MKNRIPIEVFFFGGIFIVLFYGIQATFLGFDILSAFDTTLATGLCFIGMFICFIQKKIDSPIKTSTEEGE